MDRNKRLKAFVYIVAIVLFPLFTPYLLFSGEREELSDCLGKVIERIIYIRSLPELEYLQTLDGQCITLHEFYAACAKLFPNCNLSRKFYYWQNEIKEIISITPWGPAKHTVRAYYSCFSTYCLKNNDPMKTDGDVAEFYDGNGNFMGLSVYMEDGKYCALAYSGYQK